MIEACQSPVWDTCLAVIALADAGVAPDHPALVKAADWMLAEEITRPGDWAVRRPQLAPGGWAFEFHNDNYPDIDDTAEVILALRRVKHPRQDRVEAAIARGVRWNLGMQSKNGALGRVRRRQHQRLPQPAAVLRLRRGHRPAVGRRHRPRRGDARLRGQGARSAHPARRRVAAGRTGGQRRLVRALGRQLRLRHRLGGARADRRRDPRLAPGDPPRGRLAGIRAERRRRLGRGPALVRRDGMDGPRRPRPPRRPPGRCSRCSRRGSGRARPPNAASPGSPRTSARTASWDEPYFTGTGFPWDFSINYHLYRQVFPLTALGRYVHGEPFSPNAAKGS